MLIEFDWTLLRASDGGFITSDRSYTIHDPTPPFPLGHFGRVLSSDNAGDNRAAKRYRLPSDADLLRVGGGLTVREASSRDVESINLRTYGWADTHVFGESQQKHWLPSERHRIAQTRRTWSSAPSHSPRSLCLSQIQKTTHSPKRTDVVAGHHRYPTQPDNSATTSSSRVTGRIQNFDDSQTSSPSSALASEQVLVLISHSQDASSTPRYLRLRSRGLNVVLFIGNADCVNELRTADLRKLRLVPANIRKPSLLELVTRLISSTWRKRPLFKHGKLRRRYRPRRTLRGGSSFYRARLPTMAEGSTTIR